MQSLHTFIEFSFDQDALTMSEQEYQDYKSKYLMLYSKQKTDREVVPVLNDVDFCLKLRRKGYLNIFTPFAELYHYESKTRGLEEGEKLRRYESECARFRERWKEELDAGDPYYNPNFSLDYSDFTLRF